MSVLVKGMKMPKGCHSGCPLTDRDAFTCVITGRDILGDEDTVASRPSWCPLVEVPTPHGRLIDADKEKAEIDNMIVQGEVFTTAKNFASKVLEKAPIVIEAEE